MNKRLIALFLVFLLLPLISAVEITTKTEIQKGETFLAKVSGSFFEPLNKDKIIFKRDHVRVPMITNLKKIDGDFYIYAQTHGKESGQYSITLEDVKSYNIDEIVEEDLVSNFTILDSNVDFFIDPYVIQTNKSFTIELQNIKNSQITVNSKLYSEPTFYEESEEDLSFFESLFGTQQPKSENQSEDTFYLNSTTLKSGEKRKITFDISDFSFGLNNLEISSNNSVYIVPVFSLLEDAEKPNSKKGLDFDQSDLDVTLIFNRNTSRIVYISNNGNESMDEIKLSISNSLKPYVNLSRDRIYDLENGSNASVEIFFRADSEEKTLEGNIMAQSEDYSSNLFVFLNFVDSFISSNNSNSGGRVASCSELGGVICTYGQQCRGDVESASDGNCCIGVCEAGPSRSYIGMIVGWVLIIGIVGYLLWFYLKKYKGVKKILDLLKIAGEKKE